jgi:hypothetical protein
VHATDLFLFNIVTFRHEYAGGVAIIGRCRPCPSLGYARVVARARQRFSLYNDAEHWHIVKTRIARPFVAEEKFL